MIFIPQESYTLLPSHSFSNKELILCDSLHTVLRDWTIGLGFNLDLIVSYLWKEFQKTVWKLFPTFMAQLHVKLKFTLVIHECYALKFCLVLHWPKILNNPRQQQGHSETLFLVIIVRKQVTLSFMEITSQSVSNRTKVSYSWNSQAMFLERNYTIISKNGKHFNEITGNC
jgi:hypothetical protein